MGRIASCCNCKIQLNQDNTVVISGKKYCLNCAQEKKKESEDYKKLTDYIYCNLINKDSFLMGFCVKQIKNLHENYHMKYSAITATLQYMYEFSDENIVFDPHICLANIPYYYLDAKEFFLIKYMREKDNEDYIKEIINKPENIVVLERSNLIKYDNIFDQNKRGKDGLLFLEIEEDDLKEEELNSND